MALIEASRVVLPTGVTGPAAIEVDDSGRISRIRTGVSTTSRRTLCPGFVDLQVNGHGDVDVASATGRDWDRLDQSLLSQGVTSWCPTLVSAPLEVLDARLDEVSVAASRAPGGRPTMAGVHLEGPFLSVPAAHRGDWLCPVDEHWLSALPPIVRVMTIAPELPGAPEAIRTLSSRGVLMSLGHSQATYDEAVEAVGAGARMVTHLFNAMSPMHHRQPGLVGAALSNDRLSVSLIADLHHVHPAVLAMVFAAKGPAGVVLVTDAVAASSGRLADLGLSVPSTAGPPRLADGTVAGTILTMDGAVRHVATEVGIDLAAAVTAASCNPARLLGLFDRGVLAEGSRADLVALSPDLTVEATWVAGELAWER